MKDLPFDLFWRFKKKFLEIGNLGYRNFFNVEVEKNTALFLNFQIGDVEELHLWIYGNSKAI